MPRREMTCRQRGRHRSETDHGRVASAASHSTPGAVLGARGRASGSDSRRTSRVSTGRSCRPASPAGRSTPNSSTTCPRGSIPAARTASTTRSSTPGRSSSVRYRSAWARSSAATVAISPTCCPATGRRQPEEGKPETDESRAHWAQSRMAPLDALTACGRRGDSPSIAISRLFWLTWVVGVVIGKKGVTDDYPP
jgi:hypothetical protein